MGSNYYIYSDVQLMQEGRTRRRASSSSSHTPLGTEGDQYGLSQLFLPDNAPPRSEVGGEVEGRAKLKVQTALKMAAFL